MIKRLDYQIEEYLEWILNCQTGNISELSSMLGSGYDINTKDDEGHNGLYHSIDNDEIETSFFLIENEIKCTQSDLNIASNKELEVIVVAIIDLSTENTREQLINETFYSLSLLSTFDFMDWYIQSFKPDVNYCEGHDLTPIMNVATMGNIERFNLLLSKGADINKKGNNDLDTLEWCKEVQDNPGVKDIIAKIKTLMNT